MRNRRPRPRRPGRPRARTWHRHLGEPAPGAGLRGPGIPGDAARHDIDQGLDQPVPPAAQPADGVIAGNVYRFSLTNQSGATVSGQASGGVTIVLRGPANVPSATIERFSGGSWTPSRPTPRAHPTCSRQSSRTSATSRWSRRRAGCRPHRDRLGRQGRTCWPCNAGPTGPGATASTASTNSTGGSAGSATPYC